MQKPCIVGVQETKKSTRTDKFSKGDSTMITLKEELKDINSDPALALQNASLHEVMELLMDYDPYMLFLINDFIHDIVKDIKRKRRVDTFKQKIHNSEQ